MPFHNLDCSSLYCLDFLIMLVFFCCASLLLACWCTNSLCEVRQGCMSSPMSIWLIVQSRIFHNYLKINYFIILLLKSFPCIVVNWPCVVITTLSHLQSPNTPIEILDFDYHAIWPFNYEQIILNSFV